MTNTRRWRPNAPRTSKAAPGRASESAEAAGTLAALEEEASDGRFGAGGTCSVGYQVVLPHRKLADDTEKWSVEMGSSALLVEPGLSLTSAGSRRAGVPFGPVARLILIYLRSEALRSSGRDVELGGKLRGFLARLGMSGDADPGLLIREQLERIAVCWFRFYVKQHGCTVVFSHGIVEGGVSLARIEDDGRGAALLEAVRLHDSFHRDVVKDTVLLDESALREIRGSSLALDVYCWLACRLHALASEQPIAWNTLSVQFAGEKQFGQDFLQMFVEALKAVMRIYPQARIDIMEAGVVLHPSPPPAIRATPERQSPAS